MSRKTQVYCNSLGYAIEKKDIRCKEQYKIVEKFRAIPLALTSPVNPIDVVMPRVLLLIILLRCPASRMYRTSRTRLSPPYVGDHQRYHGKSRRIHERNDRTREATNIIILRGIDATTTVREDDIFGLG
jgi:hypothetical protein